MPQQMLIARERRRATEAQKAAAPKPSKFGPTGGKGARKKG
jgi:hypothetical protein